MSRSCFPSGDQSLGPQPPPSSWTSSLSVLGSAGPTTYRSVSLPLRRVDVYASRSPAFDHTPELFFDLPSVRSVTAPVFRSNRKFWLNSLPPTSLPNTK